MATLLHKDVQVITTKDSKHSYNASELKSFVDYINSKEDELKSGGEAGKFVAAKLPINPNGDDLFHVIKDGMLLW